MSEPIWFLAQEWCVQFFCFQDYKLAQDYGNHLNMMAGARWAIPTSSVKQIAWSPPPQSWFKVNTDGSSIADRNSVACGGIIQNHDGNFIASWSVNLGACTNNLAELWGAFWGLCFSKNMGLKQVILELDSSCKH